MAKNIRRELDRLRLPDLQRRFREVTGEETRCPNRRFLIRRISESLEARAAEPTGAPLPASEADGAQAASDATSAPTLPRVAPARGAEAAKPPRASTRAERPPRGRFKSMTVEELQTRYLLVVGRPTGSTDRRYLIWKIREAEKGRVPVGPRETRTPDQQAASDTRILPLRLDAPSVAAIDATWRAQGLKSRMEFFRRALGHYLAHLGAHGAAAMFAAP